MGILFGRRGDPEKLLAQGIDCLNAADRSRTKRQCGGASANPAEHYRAAIRFFERAIKANPDSARAWHYLGLACYSLGCESVDVGLLTRSIACCEHAKTLHREDQDLRRESDHIANCARSTLLTLQRP